MSRQTPPTLGEIRSAHSWKRDYERYMPVSRYIFRPLGFLVTWVAVRIGLTTEAVSWLSGIIGAAACLCLIQGRPGMVPLGLALLLVFNLLDCVDGSIARTMKTENIYGKFLDSIMGDLVDFAFFFAVGIMAFQNPHLLLQASPPFWLAVGCVTAFVYIFLRHVEMLFEYQIYSAEIAPSPDGNIPPDAGGPLRGNDTDGSPGTETGGTDWKGIARLIDRNIRVRESIYVVLILAVILRCVDIFLLFYCIYLLLRAGLSVVVYTSRARRLRDGQ